jgi:hypothetical protein
MASLTGIRMTPYDLEMALNYETCKLIACATVIEEMLPLIPHQLDYEVLDFGLHSNPERLQKAIQSAIDASSPSIDTILLGFGMCAKATVGLKAGNRTIVVPKADDCITIFLGSAAHYNQQQRNEPGTLYLTKGWIESGTPLDEQREIMAKKYGEEKAGFLFKKMLRGYKRLVFIDTGNYELEQYRSRSKGIAERLDLRYEEIKGDSGLVKKLLNGSWDGEYVVAPPGHVVTLSDFRRF